MSKPKDQQTVTPYLILSDVEGFISFTKKVFGAVETEMHRDDNGRIMHAQVDIGGSILMMGESTHEWKPQPAGLFIYVDDADSSYKLALENGAESITEPADQNYGRSCGVKDAYGNTWWITSV